MADPTRGPDFPVIDLPSEVDTPDAAVRLLLAELVRAGWLPAGASAEVARQVWAREARGSTAVGRGVAVPHARTGTVDGAVGAVGRCTRPLDWPGAADSGPVRVVCLLVVPAGPAGLAVRELERVARRLRGSSAAE